MATAEQVHPLRLSKNPSVSTPGKMASSIPRALSEISPAEQRRNSPSWTQPAGKKMGLNTDSSPFQSSPLDGTTSPRLFWQNRDENSLYGGSGSPSPNRRSSIERLQKASRVKNSNILALEQKQEYDPARVPQIERPLAKVQGNAYGGTGIGGYRESAAFGHRRTDSESTVLGHHRNDSKTGFSLGPGPAKTATPRSPPPALNRPTTPSKDQPSPTKSALSASRFKSSYDNEPSQWSVDMSYDEQESTGDKSLHRHTKSVTFDAAPPQVNEYEMATPDLSSVGTNSREGSYDSTEDDDSYEHYAHGDDHIQEDSFDASLEDTDKTPVVGPDDWRQSPDVGRNSFLEDPFESSPMPEADPAHASSGRPQPLRAGSTDSVGDHRPLPPLPPADQARNSPQGISSTAERMLGSHRSLPSPPPAPSFSKSDIQSIGNGKMTLEERLKLMMLSDDGKSAAEQQRERRMRRAGPRDRAGSQTPEPDAQSTSNYGDEAEDTVGDISGLGDYQLPPRISRESIMRRANGNKALDLDTDYSFSSPPPSSSPERPFPVDPDVPIPSTEDSYVDEGDESDESVIRHEVAESDYDIYDMYQSSNAPSEEPEERPAGETHEDSIVDDETASLYSTQDLPEDPQPRETEEEAAATPRAATPVQEPAPLATAQQPAPEVAEPEVAEPDVAEPDVAEPKVAEPEPEAAPAPAPVPAAEPEEKEPRNKLQPFALPRPDEVESPEMANAHAYLHRPYTPDQPLSSPDYDGSGWGGPEEYEDEPGTPESVIHHPMPPESPPLIESPAIPEREATIKSASGSKLKTRPSATPSDISAMREARRQVSREVPEIPPIPERHRDRLSRDFGVEQEALSASTASDDFVDRHPSFKKRSLTLELDLGLSLDKDFERVIEAQKRGYLMRQNTKLVTASDKELDEPRRGIRSAGNSPTKADRPQSWTVEPWNPQARKSIRKKSVPAGPVPPLPGHESNAAAMKAVAEDEAAADPAPEDSGERGRLFVKVMGVKDLDLPIPKNERTWFSLTLDNGVHCVTTAWLELARNAPIGQEFELVVPNDLEFQLTLNVKLEKPPPQKVIASPSKVSKPKTSTFSRVFASPKRRKEMELRQREEEERAAREQREAQARKMKAHPTPWDLLSPLAAEDGSFARAYISLKEHEARCYGRPYLVDIACFNEWATEEAGFASSVKSKRGTNAVVRRAPYKIGKLELQLLFVPRPRGSTDDDMPKSMNSCIREMKAAEERLARNWEGHLSQQGGDCPYWRRRYFKLVGTKLTAYHEATRQPRATINLANAKRLIDDRADLTRKETTGRGGTRRRSAFAEEEEGYMFVEEGFRIRFNNGEIIDFYADTAKDKDGWMRVLGEVIGRDSMGSNGGDGAGAGDDPAGGARARGKWCELVFKREEALRRRAEGRRVHSRTKSSYV